MDMRRASCYGHFTLWNEPPVPKEWRLGGPHSQSGHVGGKEKNFHPYWKLKPSEVTSPTDLQIRWSAQCVDKITSKHVFMTGKHITSNPTVCWNTGCYKNNSLL